MQTTDTENKTAAGLIKELETEGRKLTIVEVGCGDALSGALLRTPGASRILESVIIPYSKEMQDFMCTDVWGEEDKIIPGTRAVSLENLKRLAMIGFKNSPNQDISVYAATFQITGVVHGWIGGFTDTGMIAVHVTIPIEGHDSVRDAIIEEIKNVAIQFTIDPHRTPYVDNYVNMSKPKESRGPAKHEEGEREEFLNTWMNSPHVIETILFKKDHTVGRTIELDRAAGSGSSVVLYRGSFNPLSAAHVKIATQTGAVLVIGANTFDKGSNDVHEIIHRVKTCNDAGFDVLVCKHALFMDLALNLRRQFTSPIEFVVGSDTMRRIMESYGVSDGMADKAAETLYEFSDLDVKFTVVQRKNRDGRSYEYRVPLLSSEENMLKYLEIDTDYPSSTELRAVRKNEDCNFAVNAYDAYVTSGTDKSFKEFVDDFHSHTDSRRYEV
jgi:Competence-damaged protein